MIQFFPQETAEMGYSQPFRSRARRWAITDKAGFKEGIMVPTLSRVSESCATAVLTVLYIGWLRVGHDSGERSAGQNRTVF
jgi:hypothetical protein